MDNKNKFNTVKIATCNDAHKAEAVNQLFERSLLFNRSDDICGIVISKNDKKQFIPISAIPDNVNIEKREGVVTLVENPVVDSITTQADHNGIDWKSQHKIAETSAERTIILLCTKNIEGEANIGVIGGEILEVGEGIYGHYKISLTSTGSVFLKGATTFEQKAALVCAKYNGTYYYGIKFKSTIPANIYFAGWDHFPDGADAPLYTSYNDADLSEIIELESGDSGGSSGGSSGGGTADKVANALTVNGKTYDGSSAVNAGVQTVANGGTGVTTQADINKAFIGNLEVGIADVTDGTEFVSSYASDSGFSSTDEGSLHTPYKRQFIKVWNYIKDKISSVLGLTASDYGGRARIATNADYSKNMYLQVFDLTTLDKTKFYPLVCYSGENFAEVSIHSPNLPDSAEYNQNRIHFDISTLGWSDTPPTLNIREYACYESNEITIGCIGRGFAQGAWAIWLRGGIKYYCYTRSCELSLKTSDYTYGDEVYTVGTNYYGGANSNVAILFTPQSTIESGAYSNRSITASTIKAENNFIGNLTGNVTGNSATATSASSADKAVSVVDYGDTSKTIKIGYVGAGATVDNLSHIAGYLSGGTQIKDVSKDVLKSWIGLSNYLPLSGGTVTGKLDVKTAGIRIPTSQPNSLSDGDIWIQ